MKRPGQTQLPPGFRLTGVSSALHRCMGHMGVTYLLQQVFGHISSLS